MLWEIAHSMCMCIPEKPYNCSNQCTYKNCLTNGFSGKGDEYSKFKHSVFKVYDKAVKNWLPGAGVRGENCNLNVYQPQLSNFWNLKDSCAI